VLDVQCVGGYADCRALGTHAENRCHEAIPPVTSHFEVHPSILPRHGITEAMAEAASEMGYDGADEGYYEPPDDYEG
jgi:hypothetical protein